MIHRFSTFTWFGLMFCLLCFWQCGGLPTTGTGHTSAHVRVLLQGLSASDVARVTVTISGPNITPPISQDLVLVDGAWQKTIGEIPVGDSRVFRADAYDGSDNPIYEGEVTGVTVSNSAPVDVSIAVQQKTPPAPFSNNVPVIEKITVPSKTVAVNSNVPVTLQASDPDTNDALSYTWTATGGSFDDPTSTQPTWTAPGIAGTYALTITVRDNHDAVISASFNIDVQN